MNKLTVFEANKWKERVGEAGQLLRDLLDEGYQNRVWVALGFLTWGDCLKSIANEYNLSLRHIQRLDSANRTQQLISNTNDDPGVITNNTIPERQLRPLTRLEPEQQIEAWQEAIETAPNGKITAAHVEQVVNKKTAHVSHNSGENEWYTPPEIINAAKRVMGKIDTDPASSDIANAVIQADTYYTIETDGLAWDWYGKVWMNPPYSQPLISHFCEKLTTDLMMGFVTEAITLTNNATETRWFQELTGYCSAVCFPTGRIKFIDVNGEFGNAPLQGQAIMYFGNDIERFEAEFKRFGPIFYASRQDSI